MYLFLSCEAQSPATAAIAILMKEFNTKLNFVTNRDVDLKSIDNYGTEFNDIGIIVTCISKEWLLNMDNYKERKLVRRKAKEADIRLQMDFELFIQENSENQRLMYLDTIIKSIRVIQERSKGDFRGNELVNDILKALDVDPAKLQVLQQKHSKSELFS